VSPRIDELEAALTPQEVQQFQIVQMAMGSGIALFLGIVLFLHSGRVFRPEATAEGAVLTVRILTAVHVLFTMSCWSLASFLYPRLSRLEAEQDAQAAVARLKSATIVRLALMEAPAVLGIVTVLLAGMFGVLEAHPAFWANLATAVAFFVFVVKSFPGRDRLLATLRERAQG
jgi:hypothetical protein